MGSVASSGVRDRSARLSPLPRPDAGGRIHHRGPRHQPHPRPPWGFGVARSPGPRSATRTRRGSRFTLSPLAARAYASVPPRATGRSHVSAAVRRAESRLALPENRSGTASGTPSAPRLGGWHTAAAPPPRPSPQAVQLRLSPPPTLSPAVAENQSSYRLLLSTSWTFHCSPSTTLRSSLTKLAGL
jgi:hypothetical protein